MRKKGRKAVKAKLKIMRIFLLCCASHVHADTTKISFDVLFPATPFKNVLHSCMQIRNAIVSINQYKDKPQDYTILIDILLGRMTYLQTRIESMLSDKSCHMDDLEYLVGILDYMEQETNQLLNDGNHERETVMVKMINGIKNSLEQTLSKVG